MRAWACLFPPSRCQRVVSVATSVPSLSLLVQADLFNNLLRRVNTTSGLVSTLAGNVALGGGPPNNYGFADGYGTAATFHQPFGVAVDAASTAAYIVSD